MSEAFQILNFVVHLRIDPLAAVIVVAVILAYLEQQRQKRKTPQFTADHEGSIGGKPTKNAY